MSQDKYRLLIVSTHPVQYSAPIFRLMAEHPQLDILVAYCNMQGAELGLDRGFGLEIVWDIPLLDGYPWIQIKNLSPKPNLGHFWGLVNWDLIKLIQEKKFNAIVSLTGYNYGTFWMVAIIAKLKKIPLLFGTDAHELRPRSGESWKTKLKAIILPLIFSLADTVIVPSSGGIKLMQSLGITDDKIQLTPYVVNNDWWLEQSAKVNRSQVREQWNIPETSPVVLFCAKLQPWKSPQHLLHAFAQANVQDTYLVFVGSGPLQQELETTAQVLGISEQIRFLGFVNQSQLPSVYTSADLFVFPSEYEPFGVVVNEAMLCGCPVIASNRIGAKYDLIREGETGFIYPWGEIDTLTKILQEVLPNREGLKQMGETARNRMETWHPHYNVEALIQAIKNCTDTTRKIN